MLNTFQLATSLYSCAVLQIPLFSLKTGTFSMLLPALETAICAQVKQFNDRDVSSTLYAYAQLKPHTAVDAARKQQSYNTALQLARQAQRLISRKEMSGQSMSMVLWSLATLHSNNSGSNDIAAGSRSVVAGATRVLLQQEISFDQLGSQVVANSIWAAEKLGQADVQLLQKGCDWMAQNPQKCKVQEVLNVLWAAGAARYRPKLLGTLTRHIAGQVKVSCYLTMSCFTLLFCRLFGLCCDFLYVCLLTAAPLFASVGLVLSYNQQECSTVLLRRTWVKPYVYLCLAGPQAR